MTSPAPVSARILLEIQLQRELNDPRVDGRGGDHPEAGRRDVAVRVGELWRVEGVEKLRPELEVGVLAQAVERRPLDDGDVEVVLTRASRDADAAVAEGGAAAVGADHRPD